MRQPISFNHKKHVTELDIACTTCHVTVETEAFSGLPDAELCAGCHLEPQGKSEEEKRLVEMLKKGTALAWKPLFRQPAHVFYSHRRHVIAAKLQCRRLPRRDRGHHLAPRPREAPRDERLRLVPPKRARLDGLHGVSPMSEPTEPPTEPEVKGIERRRFIGLAIGAAAGTALGIPAGSVFSGILGSAESPLYPPKGPERFALSVCALCPGGCGVRVRKIGERAVKLEGNPLHPVNAGRLCPKGQAGLQGLYHPDRVPGPLREGRDLAALSAPSKGRRGRARSA